MAVEVEGGEMKIKDYYKSMLPGLHMVIMGEYKHLLAVSMSRPDKVRFATMLEF